MVKNELLWSIEYISFYIYFVSILGPSALGRDFMHKHFGRKIIGNEPISSASEVKLLRFPYSLTTIFKGPIQVPTTNYSKQRERRSEVRLIFTRLRYNRPVDTFLNVLEYENSKVGC